MNIKVLYVAIVLIVIIGLIVLSSIFGVKLKQCNDDKKKSAPLVMDTMISQEHLQSVGNELAKSIRKINVTDAAAKLQKMQSIIAMEKGQESKLGDLHAEKAEIAALDSNINAGRMAPKGSEYSPKTAILAALDAQTKNYSREKEHQSDRKEANMRVAAQEDELANVVTGMEGLALEKFQGSGLEDVLSGAEHLSGLEDVLMGAEHMSELLTADDDYIEDTDEVVSDRVSQGDIVKVIQAKPKSCKKVYNRGNNKEYFCGRRIFDVNNEICPLEDKYGKDSVCNENHPSKKAFGRRDKVYVDVSQYMRNYEENVHDPSYYHSLY